MRHSSSARIVIAAVALVHLHEPVPLVELHGRAVLGDAERDRAVAVRPRTRQERIHQLAAEPVAPSAGDDRDRELGRLLVDEPVAPSGLLEEPVPGRADGKPVVERDHGCIAASAPVLDVAHRVQTGLVLVPGAPVVGMAQHVAEKTRVLRRPRADHRGESM